MEHMNYSHLTQVQKFDGLSRLARATLKFAKAELLTAEYSTDKVSMAWQTELKGLPIMDFTTLEIVEASPFALTCTIHVNMYNMVTEVTCAPIKETEDKVTLALCEKYRRDVQFAMEETDLSPLTRTRKSKDDKEE